MKVTISRLKKLAIALAALLLLASTLLNSTSLPTTSAAADEDDSGALYGFVSLIVLIGAVILCGIAWLA